MDVQDYLFLMMEEIDTDKARLTRTLKAIESCKYNRHIMFTMPLVIGRLKHIKRILCAISRVDFSAVSSDDYGAVMNFIFSLSRELTAYTGSLKNSVLRCIRNCDEDDFGEYAEIYLNNIPSMVHLTEMCSIIARYMASNINVDAMCANGLSDVVMERTMRNLRGELIEIARARGQDLA